MADNNIFRVEYMTEKKEGHGEDAPPLLIAKDDSWAVGVFDGMGGAGAGTCESALGEGHTKAYVASRIVEDVVRSYLTDNLGVNEITAESLKATISERLRTEQEQFPPKTKSLLRSKLVRDYPTTMALVTLIAEGDSLKVDSYWAGDSHCYLWNIDGFFQISKDDLEEDNDPMENLHNDSPISNCICADRDFEIHRMSISLKKEPVIILCSTDGCFGYYQTPMHFEHVLKSCLEEVEDEKTWSAKIEQEISKVTGDDCSLSLIAWGFSSFSDLKKSMKSSSVTGFSKLLNLEMDIACAEQILTKAKEDYEKGVAEGWSNYKQNYMKYIKE